VFSLYRVSRYVIPSGVFSSCNNYKTKSFGFAKYELYGVDRTLDYVRNSYVRNVHFARDISRFFPLNFITLQFFVVTDICLIVIK